MIKILAYCDSLCEPKGKRGPGPMDVGYWACAKLDGPHPKLQHDEVLFAQHEVIRNDFGSTLTGTCNQAEYYGLIRMHAAVVKWLAGRNIPLTEVELHIHSDSQLMVRQMNKEWKIRHPDIKLLHTKANSLQTVMAFTVHKIDRESNGLADSLAQSRVLKGSGVMGEFKDGTYMVKQHTPCAEFLRGKNPYALLTSRLPELKARFLATVTNQAAWAEIEAQLAGLNQECAQLQARIQPINAKVDEWLKSTFRRFDGDMAEFQEFITARDRQGLTDAVTAYFHTLAHSGETEVHAEDEGQLSKVNEDFLCGYKLNRGPKQDHKTISQVDDLEGRREEVYQASEPTPQDAWMERFGMPADERSMLMDGRFED